PLPVSGGGFFSRALMVAGFRCAQSGLRPLPRGEREHLNPPAAARRPPLEKGVKERERDPLWERGESDCALPRPLSQRERDIVCPPLPWSLSREGRGSF